MTTATEMVNFWFSEPIRRAWFRSTPELDQQIATQWHNEWQAAREHQYDHWAESPEGALALVILLDQLPLNMFRGQALAFATAEQALGVARHAVAHEHQHQLSSQQQPFLLMPFMHSESLADQQQSVRLFTALNLEQNLRFAHHHHDLIRRFGRFPHRNALLGRPNTTAEQAYLTSDSAFHG